MTEFQLTHIALIGARMATFKTYGFDERNQLALRVVIPEDCEQLATLSGSALCTSLKNQLPLWVHNIISDPQFPQREKLLMPLRRFEGELHDNRSDEVISSVLSAGFKNLPMDPLNLPTVMPLRQRCALVIQIGVWQDAYRKLEQDLLELLEQYAQDIARWCTLYQDEEARCLAAQ